MHQDLNVISKLSVKDANISTDFPLAFNARRSASTTELNVIYMNINKPLQTQISMKTINHSQK